jgi:DNA repair protein RadC
MSINNWLTTERPREKLLAKGAAALSDAELLAILLRTGTKGKTAVDLARELLTTCGGLRKILESDFQKLKSYSGIGIAKFVQLQAALEIARRNLQENLQKKDALSNPAATKQYLCSQLRHHQQEIFACIFLDSHNQIIRYEELFFGTINSSNIFPREVVKKALSYNAAGVIFAHNHPSGIARPSNADKQITAKLIKALDLVDIKVLDHVIVGDVDCLSFVEHDLL